MSALLRDLRVSSRALRKHAGLSVVAVTALTLGIGLTTTMFSIVYGALMKGLPFADGDRIVMLVAQNLSRNWTRMSPSYPDYVEFRRQQRSFSELAAYTSGTVLVSGTERAERYGGSWVTANMFTISGVSPILGRTFRQGEDAVGGEQVAVVSYAMWQNRFGGERSIIGKSIRVNGVPHTVIGVMPEGYAFPDNDAIWLPLQIDPLVGKRSEARHVEVVGKLRPGVTLDAVNAEVNVTSRRLAETYKETNEGLSATVMPFTDGQIGPEPRRLLYTMLGAVFFVLLIACANVANLLLDRAAHRTKEVGIRTALGASRVTVVRQFLTEALVLASVGTVLGVAASYFGVRAFNRAIASTDPPFWIDIRLHPPVLLFAIGVAVIATLASGILPSLQASRTDINEILKDESRGASSLRIGRLSRALVVFEIALSCGLLVAAGLMIKSVVRLRQIDPGFTTANVFTARVGFPSAYTDTLQQRQFFEGLQQRLASVPGVEAVSLSTSLPGTGIGSGSFAIEGKSYAKDTDYPRAGSMRVAAGFFSTFQLRILQGRGIGSEDRVGTVPVAVVNQAAVAKYFAGVDPIGKRVRLGDSKSTAPWLTIVGVVPNTFSGDPEEPRAPAIYTSLAQFHSSFASIALRVRGGNPMAITPQVRDVVASLNPDIAIYFVYSMKEAIARQLWFVRVFGTMFMIFGMIALFLAGIGLYAVMAFSVSRRTREVGIRVALGAQAGHVIGMVLRQGLLQLAVGMTFGLALALGVSRLLQIILFEVQPRDPFIFAGVIAVLSAAGMLACLIPARRATRIDPLDALRSE